MATTFDSNNDGYFSLEALSTSESTEAIESKNGGFLAGAIHVVDGNPSTGWNGGTATIQASLDGTNWFTAKDTTGSDMTLTDDGYFEFCLAARYIRVSNDGSVSDVDVAVFLT